MDRTKSAYEEKNVVVELVNPNESAEDAPPPPPPPPPAQELIQQTAFKAPVVVEEKVESTVGIMEDLVSTPQAAPPTDIEEVKPIEDNSKQVIQEKHEELPIFTVVEVQPEFKGGMSEFYNYLKNNIQYPQMAREMGISGTVYVEFVVEIDGSITNVKIKRGIGGGCDEEALRVIKSMPKWTPGQQQGKNVRVSFIVPVKFTISG